MSDSALAQVNFDDTHGSVIDSPELRRIIALPRRRWQDGALHIEAYTKAFGKGTQEFWPVQAAILNTLFECGGCFAPVGVGEGKTLPTFVAATLLGAKRPLLLIPKKMEEKTLRDFAKYAKHWEVDVEPKLVGYKWLGLEKQKDFLNEYQPDLLMGDECHHLQNLSAAVTRRFFRYVASHPDVPVMLLSGTVTSRSLREFHHLLQACLGASKSPLPRQMSEVHNWARAVDEKVDIRARPGSLRLLLPLGEVMSLANIRSAVGQRVDETAGVIATKKRTVEASIILERVYPKQSAAIKFALQKMHKTKVGPDGIETTPADIHRHTQTLTCGFFYELDPKPPEDWLSARRGWNRFVRQILESLDPRFDSELQVENAAARGVFGTLIPYERWQRIRKTFKPNRVTRWIDTSVVEQIPQHLRKPTIIWVHFTALGEKISELLEIPFFHHKGFDAGGNFIEDASGHIVASIGSCSDGFNLQYKWSHNYFVNVPALGAKWEQMWGRTHRKGQLADEVHGKVQLGHPVLAKCLRQAFDDAEYIHRVTGNPQKLLIVDEV